MKINHVQAIIERTMWHLEFVQWKKKSNPNQWKKSYQECLTVKIFKS